jgi:methylmalonyl-CoA/ethylmalonyl-CoA epimerase
VSVPPQFAELNQIGIVVRDLEQSMAQYHRLLGWGPWDVYEYESPWLRDTWVHGEQVDYTFLGAETLVGGIVIELIQPLTGPSIYTEWLATKGEGLHHILVGWAGDLQSEPAGGLADTSADDLEARSTVVREHLAAEGIGVLMSGRIGDESQYYYLDTEPQLKIIVEGGGARARDLKVTRRFPA